MSRATMDGESKPNPHLENPDIRVTDTHIYFLRGILSNWYLSPYPFTGQRALELCLAQLDEFDIPHPAEDAISTRLIKSFRFRRGEQWMMAMKAWLFERESTPLGESVLDDASFDQLQAEMLSDKPAPGSNDPRRKELRESVLCRIMRTNNPKPQKTLGRKVPNFDDAVWTTASGVIVVAGCVARAEADDELKKLYFSSEKRVFVEGSASDRVWAVGLDWESDEILDKGNWRGTNRLGKAHMEAARILSDNSAAR
ncbi:NADAR family protein [Aspergillus foveolatus]|uniref:NADAR family protein n=1 Tax=Aspergillus foveolatus TaxID=210207 RepID=UPI003CCD0112